MVKCAHLLVHKVLLFLEIYFTMNISIYLYIIILAIVLGLVRFRMLYPRFLQWMVPFLVLSLIVEVTGLVTSRHSIQNLWMYNFFTCFEFIFYSLLYRKIIENTVIKKTILSTVIIYLVLFSVNIFFIQGFYRLHTITYRIGSVMVV